MIKMVKIEKCEVCNNEAKINMDIIDMMSDGKELNVNFLLCKKCYLDKHKIVINSKYVKEFKVQRWI